MGSKYTNNALAVVSLRGANSVTQTPLVDFRRHRRKEKGKTGTKKEKKERDGRKHPLLQNKCLLTALLDWIDRVCCWWWGGCGEGNCL